MKENKELKDMLYKYAKEDIDFDKMPKPETPDYSERHLKMMDDLFDEKEDNSNIFKKIFTAVKVAAGIVVAFFVGEDMFD